MGFLVCGEEDKGNGFWVKKSSERDRKGVRNSSCTVL